MDEVGSVNVYLNNSRFARVMSQLFCDASGNYSSASVGHAYSHKRLRKDFVVGNLALSQPSILDDDCMSLLNGGITYTITGFNEFLANLLTPSAVYDYYHSEEFDQFFAIPEGVWVSMFFCAYVGGAAQDILDHIKQLEEKSSRSKIWRIKTDIDLNIAEKFHFAFHCK